MTEYLRLLADERARIIRRGRLIVLTMWCMAVLAIATLMHLEPVGASSPSYIEHCHSSPEAMAWCEHREWAEWMADPANEAWFYDQHGVIVAVGRHFGVGPLGQQAMRVVDCESQRNPHAVSRTDDHGLFQLNRPSWERRFADVTGHPFFDGVYDPDLNATFARWLYDQSGWAPWACRP